MAGRNYSYAELHAMQQDAVRRVMEMQRIADERVRRSSGRRERPDRRQGRPQTKEGKSASGGEQRGGAPPSLPLPDPRSAQRAPFFTAGALEGFVKRLGLETDQLIVLGLLLLLIDEGADASLILAVFYLLL